MIKFKHEANGLKQGESYMYCDKAAPSPLIKIKTEDSTPEKWGSLTDDEFIKSFCKDFPFKTTKLP